MSTQTEHGDGGLLVRQKDGTELRLSGKHATAYLLEHGLIEKTDPDIQRLLADKPDLDPVGTVTHVVAGIIPDHHHHADGSSHPSHPAGHAAPVVPASRSAAPCPDCH